MEQTWRWYGPNDPITLADIRQTGATGIVNALHEIPNGKLWTVEAISERKAMIEAAGLRWSVVESIPIHEDVKTAAPGWEKYAEIWAQSMANLAKCGVNVICYNFMPIIDWTRTELFHELPDGAKALRFDAVAFAAFDIFVLEREGAAEEHGAEMTARAKAYFDAMSQADIDKLTGNILAGLPGAEESYTVEDFKAHLKRYAGVTPAILRERLGKFLDIVLPVAEEAGAKLAIHPDDPPRDLFGLPRIMSTAADMDALIARNDSMANGFTFCTGSYGVRPENDLPAMLKKWADRVYFLHLRATKREEEPLSFHEAPHLEGDVDMVAVMREALAAAKLQGVDLPYRPDHGHMLLDDHNRRSNPGYPLIGRMRGLAELRGIEYALTALNAG